MSTLFHSGDSRSFRVLWALEELTMTYDLVMLAFPPRHYAPEYLQINPLGTVPLYIDDDVRMTESSAICQYLAAKDAEGRIAVKLGDVGYGDYLNALHFGEATLTIPLTLILRYGLFESESRKSQQIVEDYRRWFLARVKVFGAQVEENEFAAANRFTAADISIGYALLVADYLGLIAQCPPSVGNYLSRLKGREGFTRAVNAQNSASHDQGVPITKIPSLF